MTMSICAECLEPAEETTWDDGFYYDYGSITNAWHSETRSGSDCCGADLLEGTVFLDVTSVHTARKDHFNKAGKLIVAKGQRYRKSLKKGYYIDDSGEHCGIYKLHKEALRTPKPRPPAPKVEAPKKRGIVFVQPSMAEDAQSAAMEWGGLDYP
jgi:hypothetical protein